MTVHQSIIMSNRFSIISMILIFVVVAGSPVLSAQTESSDPALTGAQIYQMQCAECHGDNGEGTELDYPHPLQGDKSLGELTAYIEAEMPSGFAEECVGEDAEKVAAFILESFYSKAAQIRNAPPRIELARLTVDQYRNAVADIIGSFRNPGEQTDRHGLKAGYYDSRSPRRSKKKLDRVDPLVNFAFGTEAPNGIEGLRDNEFSIQWNGNVRAPETGYYDFVIHTPQATKLWVNDLEDALIDAYVQSGDTTEFRGSLFLLAGHRYPIRLDFSKAFQGVDDDKNKKKTIEAGIKLAWIPPDGVEQVIPTRFLSPDWSEEQFAVSTPFPPDDRNMGFERGTTVSQAWEEATTEAAIETASYVAEHLERLAQTKMDAEDYREKLRNFASEFVERAFRRPMTEEQEHRYVVQQFEGVENPELAVKRVVLLTLKSPWFLYREVDGGTDPFEIASRISFALWDSIPDKQLLQAAAQGKLETPEEVARHAERMLEDPRAEAKLLGFLHHWLALDHGPELAKDRELFPDFDEKLANDLKTSLDLFLESILSAETADFRKLFLDDRLFLNSRLAEFYGSTLSGDSTPESFEEIVLDDDRLGVITHPYLLSKLAYTDVTSPIHRGVFLSKGVLGRAMNPPPGAFTPLAPDLHPDLTTRERVTLQTSPNSCMSCHGMINQLGFTLERFDAVGRPRVEERDKPINATGSYRSQDGAVASFDGAKELIQYLAESDEVHLAFVTKLFHHTIKQSINAYRFETAERLRARFAEHQYDIKQLMVDVVTTAALQPRIDTSAVTATSLSNAPSSLAD